MPTLEKMLNTKFPNGKSFSLDTVTNFKNLILSACPDMSDIDAEILAEEWDYRISYNFNAMMSTGLVGVNKEGSDANT